MSGFVVIACGAFCAAFASWWGMRAYAHADAAAPASPRGPLIASAVFACAALGAYLSIGQPQLMGAPYADRMAALKHTAQVSPERLTAEQVVALLHDAAKEHPDQAQPLVLLGDVEAQLGRAEPAMAAFQEALRRDPRSPDAMIGIGRVIVARQRGEVSADARALFVQAGALAPDSFDPPFFLALAAYQDGNLTEARRLWRRALTLASPDEPRRAMINQMLAEP